MFRRVELVCPNASHALVSVVYYVRGAKMFAENVVVDGGYNGMISDATAHTSAVFNDSIRFFCYDDMPPGRQMVYMLDIDENQPTLERVREITNKGASVKVYNANGVLVCDNGVAISGNSEPAQAVVPGETTSEPIDGTGETTSEPIDGTGEMTSEPIDETGARI